MKALICGTFCSDNFVQDIINCHVRFVWEEADFAAEEREFFGYDNPYAIADGREKHGKRWLSPGVLYKAILTRDGIGQPKVEARWEHYDPQMNRWDEGYEASKKRDPEGYLVIGCNWDFLVAIRDLLVPDNTGYLNRDLKGKLILLEGKVAFFHGRTRNDPKVGLGCHVGLPRGFFIEDVTCFGKELAYQEVDKVLGKEYLEQMYGFTWEQ